MLAYADYVNSYLTTPQMVRDLVNFSPDSYTHGICICDYAATTHNPDLSPWLLADGTNDASKYLLGNPQVTYSETEDIPRKASWQLDGKISSQVQTLKTMFQLYRCYYDWNDNQILKVPRGFFIPTIPKESALNDDGDSVLDVTGEDQTRLLQDIQPLHAVAMPQGMNVKVAALGILMMDQRIPAEGGRSPSGVAVAGGSQFGFPSLTGPVSGTYTTAGVAVTTYTVDPATGYLKSPDGVYGFVFYNPYGGARADATSHAPIDPWSGMPMLPLPSLTSHAGGATNIWLSSKTSIAYNSAQGVFYHMSSTTTLDVSQPWDVFNNSPLPAGLTYKQPDITNPPSGTIGTLIPPLASFPNDYNGVLGAYQPTPTVPTTVTSGNPDGMVSLLYAHTMAQRTSNIDEYVLTDGVYSSDTGITQTDPQNPGVTEIVPQTGTSSFIDGMLAVSQTFPAATWTINCMFQGFGLKNGQIALGSCDVYWKDATLTYHHLGTLVSAGSGQPFTTVPLTQNVWATASGSLPGFTTDIGGQIALKIQVDAVNCFGNYSSGATSIASLTFRGFTTGAGNYGSGSGSTTPTTTGTSVPWPDTNAPAMAPSGCVCYGGGLPASRIKFPDTDVVLPVTNVWDKGTSLAAKITELCLIAGWNPAGFDENGDYVTEMQDYYLTSTLPVIEKTYSNVLTGSWFADSWYTYPIDQTVPDQSNLANTIEDTSSSDQTGEGLVAIMSNNSPDSPLAYANSGRRIIRLASNDALATQDQLNTDALQRLYAATEAGQAIEIQAPTDPFLSRRNSVNVIQQLDDGTRKIDGTSNPFRVNAWAEELQNPVQRIVCGRMVPIVSPSTDVGGIGGNIGEPVGA